MNVYIKTTYMNDAKNIASCLYEENWDSKVRSQPVHSDAFWQILVQTSTDTAADWIF